MVYQKIDENYIGDVLSDFKGKKESIQKDIREMYGMLRNKEQLKIDAIESASYLSGLDEETGKKSGDVGTTLWVYQKLLKEQQTSISSYITQLVNELDTVHRIMLCFFALDRNSRELLELFYGKYKEEKVEVRLHMIATHLGISGSTVKRRRKEAMQELMELYNSRTTSEELLRFYDGK